MELTIETKDYDLCFGKQIACYVSMVLYTFWKKNFTQGSTVYIDRKTMKRLKEYCEKDADEYFGSLVNDAEYLKESLNSILMVMRKNEKAEFRFF